jgi:hypothetical protein
VVLGWRGGYGRGHGGRGGGYSRRRSRSSTDIWSSGGLDDGGARGEFGLDERGMAARAGNWQLQ